MNFVDQFMLALCLWREARGVGNSGMVAVACVIRNRVVKHKSSYYIEVTKPLQFSSITAKGDPQLGLYPKSYDSSWQLAQQLAANVEGPNMYADNTMGATLYYDDSIDFPKSWDEHKVESTVKIGRLNFFKELV
jgi:N-acetylmuramoyl-L-alanine amidase